MADDGDRDCNPDDCSALPARGAANRPCLTPGSPGQQLAQTQIVAQLEAASEARRQRILVSGSHIGALKWWCVFVQAVCALFAVAVVHSDDRLARAIALGVFATGIAASVLLITAFGPAFPRRTRGHPAGAPASDAGADVKIHRR